MNERVLSIQDLLSIIQSDIRFPEYSFFISADKSGNNISLQANYLEEDTLTHNLTPQFTRKWPIPPEMTKSQFVNTCFKCVLTSAEHRVREWFTYKGQRIFSPHFDVDALAELSAQITSFDEPGNI